MKKTITAIKNDLVARNEIAQAILSGAKVYIRTESYMKFAVDGTGMLTTEKSFKFDSVDRNSALALLWSYTTDDADYCYVFRREDGSVILTDVSRIVDKCEGFWTRRHTAMGDASERNPTNREIYDWIVGGGLCTYRCGFGWKGARQSFITQSEAVTRLINNKFSELEWDTHDGKEVLCFQKYCGSDYD